MSALTKAHIAAEAELRRLVKQATVAIWRGLPGYDRADVETFVDAIVPIIEAAQRQSVALTEGYLARALERQPLGLDPAALSGAAVRNGATPAEVYARPFVTVWTALKDGRPYEDAVAAGLARATETAAMDVQLSARATFDRAIDLDDNIYGYQRVADGDACAFCQEVDGAYVKASAGFAFALHNNCVLGDSRVWAPPSGGGAKATSVGGAHAATRRWYEGEVVVIKTAAGHDLTVTPNHPILTDRGWVAAGILREGDGVISSRRLDGVCGGVPHKENVPARIEDYFRPPLVGPLASVPFAAEKFHGDRGNGEVDVVSLHGGLDARHLTALFEPVEHLELAGGLRDASAFACPGCGRERRGRWDASARRSVGRRYPALALGRRRLTGGDAILFAPGALRDAGTAEDAVHGGSRNTMPRGDGEHRIASPVFLDDGGAIYGAPPWRKPAISEGADQRLSVDADSARGLLDRLAGDIELDRLVFVGRRNLAAHVFNLVTECGWYSANAILTHNCGCSLEPLTEPHKRAVHLPDGTRIRPYQYGPLNSSVAVNEHGELGAVLGSPDHNFTGPSGLA